MRLLALLPVGVGSTQIVFPLPVGAPMKIDCLRLLSMQRWERERLEVQESGRLGDFVERMRCLKDI